MVLALAWPGAVTRVLGDAYGPVTVVARKLHRAVGRDTASPTANTCSALARGRGPGGTVPGSRGNS